MAIIPKFSINDFNKIFKKQEEFAKNQIIRVWRYAGEKAVNEAKARGDYQDRTANLRNSIGFVIAVDGKIIDEDFKLSVRGLEPSKEDPIKYGKDLAYEVAGSTGGDFSHRSGRNEICCLCRE